MEAEPPKRKRRWFQFSLRSLLILTLGLGIGARWITVKAQRQKTAVDAILKDGGAVVYDYQIDAAGNEISNAKPSGPDWLRKWLGDDYFVHVVRAQVRSDAGMAAVSSDARNWLGTVCGRECVLNDPAATCAAHF